MRSGTKNHSYSSCLALQCLPGGRTEDIVEVDMEDKGDWLKDDDVEEEEDTVGEDRPGY